MKEVKQDEGLGRVCMLKLTLAGQEGEGSTQESDSNSGVNQIVSRCQPWGTAGGSVLCPTGTAGAKSLRWGWLRHAWGRDLGHAEQTRVRTDELAEGTAGLTGWGRNLKCKESEVTHVKSLQSCPTLCEPMGCSLPGSSIHGIFQARILEWVAISFSRVSSWPRDRTQVSHIAGRHLPSEPPGNLWCKYRCNRKPPENFQNGGVPKYVQITLIHYGNQTLGVKNQSKDTCVMGRIVSSQNLHLETLTPSTLECIWIFTKVIKLKGVIRMAPISMRLVSI